LPGAAAPTLGPAKRVQASKMRAGTTLATRSQIGVGILGVVKSWLRCSILWRASAAPRMGIARRTGWVPNACINMTHRTNFWFTTFETSRLTEDQ